MPNGWQRRPSSTAFAFRGYNTTNLGRSAELLAHPAYGPIVERWLGESSAVCADVVGRPIDLAARVRRGEETTLATYDEAISLNVAMDLAQIELLETFFGFRFKSVRLCYGYSLGELAAVIASGVFQMQHALRVPLEMAADCVALADGVTMGVLFSRGPLLDHDKVTRLCLEVNAEGKGVIGVSSILAPNAILLLGQYGTLDRFATRMHETFPDRVYLRRNSGQWPPIHTPIVWERNIPNRVARILHTLPGGMTRPLPQVFSLVTGKASYTELNARDLLTRWLDHPQRLWDAVYETLASGVETVVHVGPSPNLIPATFKRLHDNVESQLAGNSFNSLTLRAVSTMVRRPWLQAILPSRSALLRATMVEHVILEDWLLEQSPEAPNA
jgi:[acyl-carrier-protein] S-malonyltransferase